MRTPARRRTLRYDTVLPWLAATATAACVIKGSRIGPVVAVVSDRHGWGVHSGDVLALAPLALALAWHLSRRAQ